MKHFQPVGLSKKLYTFPWMVSDICILFRTRYLFSKILSIWLMTGLNSIHAEDDPSAWSPEGSSYRFSGDRDKWLLLVGVSLVIREGAVGLWFSSALSVSSLLSIRWCYIPSRGLVLHRAAAELRLLSTVDINYSKLEPKKKEKDH